MYSFCAATAYLFRANKSQLSSILRPHHCRRRRKCSRCFFHLLFSFALAVVVSSIWFYRRHKVDVRESIDDAMIIMMGYFMSFYASSVFTHLYATAAISSTQCHWEKKNGKRLCALCNVLVWRTRQRRADLWKNRCIISRSFCATNLYHLIGVFAGAVRNREIEWIRWLVARDHGKRSSTSWIASILGVVCGSSCIMHETLASVCSS